MISLFLCRCESNLLDKMGTVGTNYASYLRNYFTTGEMGNFWPRSISFSRAVKNLIVQNGTKVDQSPWHRGKYS